MWIHVDSQADERERQPEMRGCSECARDSQAKELAQGHMDRKEVEGKMVVDYGSIEERRAHLE